MYTGTAVYLSDLMHVDQKKRFFYLLSTRIRFGEKLLKIYVISKVYIANQKKIENLLVINIVLDGIVTGFFVLFIFIVGCLN